MESVPERIFVLIERTHMWMPSRVFESDLEFISINEYKRLKTKYATLKKKMEEDKKHNIETIKRLKIQVRNAHNEVRQIKEGDV